MKNIAGIERIIRIFLGTALISLVFIGPKTQWGWLGIILLVTGSINFCPIYRILGMGTNKK